MARKPGSGGESGKSIYLIAVLVFFVFAFILTLVIAILFNADRDRARIAEAEAIKQRKLVITDDELKSAEVEDLKNRAAETGKATGGKPLSVMSFMLKEMQWYKQRITGNISDTPSVIRQKLSRAEVGDDTFLISVIDRLKAERADNDNQIKLAREAAEKATADLKRSQEEQTAKLGQQQGIVDQLKANLKENQTKQEEYQANSDKEVAKIQAMSQKSREDVQKELQTARTMVDQKDREISDLQKRVRNLTEERSGKSRSGDPVDPSVLADGKLISILAEESLVYTDIGRQAHVLPGMTFEVFDKSVGRAVKDEQGEFRGKATIEVINVLNDSSVCRVVRRTRAAAVYGGEAGGGATRAGGMGVRYAPLNEGDIIVNAVYDPNYKFKFLVFGEFDIDNTGASTTSDRRRIETTVREWGGVIAEEISYDLDFLVLGAEPKLPDALPNDETDEAKIKAFTQAKKKYEQYQNLIASARQLAIPILNQNRFLALIGYYRR